MHLHHNLLLFAFAVTLCFSAGCEEETEVNRKAILGHWEIVQGLRNGKETETMADTRFHFGEDGMMETNLPVGVESPAKFEVDKNTIRQLGRQTINYSLKSFTDSTMTLGLDIRGMTFEMQLRRATPEPDSSSLSQ